MGLSCPFICIHILFMCHAFHNEGKLYESNTNNYLTI